MDTITIYQAYKNKGIPLSRTNYLLVGIKAKELYEQITGETPPKISQQEPQSIYYTCKNPRMVTYQVYCYPKEFEQLLFNLIEQASSNK